MRKFMSVLLSAAMVLTAVPVSVAVSPVVEVNADECQVDVTDYTYEITPILAPFGEYIYVKTDNPDPFSFRFVDYDSVYIDDDSYDDHATYEICPVRFEDVKYENDYSFRVNGGYIFYTQYVDSDGGELMLMQATEKLENKSYTYTWGTDNSIEVYYYSFEETDVTVKAPKFVDYIDYLIDTYTSDDNDFFENLDAACEGLYELAIYPAGVYDSSNPTGIYPYLAFSPYMELSLNEHYSDMYEKSDGILLTKAYPYILDSLGYPSALTYVAQRLDDSVEIGYGSTHSQRTITYNGETKTYGGQGNGGSDPIYTEFIETLFMFDGSSGDYFTSGTIDSYSSKIMEYKEMATEAVVEYEDLLSGDTFYETINATGGTWIRVVDEWDGPNGASEDYAYVVPAAIYESVYILSDAWVDGRYISAWENSVSATFEEHPTADIVVSDMTYTDRYGNEHTQDVIFEYDSDTETWIAGYGFHGYSSNIPDEFVLTADEVAAMNVDSMSDVWPESGLIYDGSAYPGTEFTNILATKIEVDEKVEVVEGKEIIVNYILTPENLTSSKVTCTSEDDTIAHGVYDNYMNELMVYGVGVGTTNVIVTSNDGACQTTVEVTVTARDTSDDFTYEKTSASTVALVDYTGSDSKIEIPSKVDGCSVTEIGHGAFYEQTDINDVTVPESVTSIDYEAFRYCYYLGHITLPDSLTHIGKCALMDCSNLQELIIPDSVTEIEDYAFSFCCSVTSVTLPSGLTTISRGLLSYCFSMEDVWIPAGVTSIGDNAFYGCDDLTDVYFEGTEEEWDAITIGENNEDLTSATIHFNSSRLGDVTGDGSINYLDAMSVLRYDAELISLTDSQLTAGDVNGDGSVNSLDAILILRYDAGLISSFN